jgi:hypothetical protein
MRFGRDLRVEDDLRQAVAVAQIDEDESTKVTPPVDPAPQCDVPSDIVKAKRAAGQPANDGGIDVMSDGHADSLP